MFLLRKPATGADLPDDIWHVAIQMLVEERLFVGRLYLRSLSLTSRRMRQLCVQRLFRSICIDSASKLDRFLHITEVNPNLVDHVREVTLSSSIWDLEILESSSISRGTQLTRKRLDGILSLGEQSSTRLRKLTMVFDSDNPFPPKKEYNYDFTSSLITVKKSSSTIPGPMMSRQWNRTWQKHLTWNISISTFTLTATHMRQCTYPICCQQSFSP